MSIINSSQLFDAAGVPPSVPEGADAAQSRAACGVRSRRRLIDDHTSGQVDENISLEVYFDPADQEQGFEDKVRFRIYESGPEDFRIFAADETSFLLTCEQADRLAAALQEAAEDSKNLPRSVYPGFPSPDW